MKFKDGVRFAVIGKSGYGKSYFVKKILIPLLLKIWKKPIIILDIKQEYAGKRAVDHSSSWNEYSGWNEFVESVTAAKKIPVDVHVIKTDAKTENYTDCLNGLMNAAIPATVIFEEAYNLKNSDFRKNVFSSVMDVARRGRSFGIDLIVVSQRPNDMHPDIRSQMDGIISFFQDHPDDVKHIESKDYEAGQKVNSLKKREYVLAGDLPEFIRKNL